MSEQDLGRGHVHYTRVLGSAGVTVIQCIVTPRSLAPPFRHSGLRDALDPRATSLALSLLGPNQTDAPWGCTHGGRVGLQKDRST